MIVHEGVDIHTVSCSLLSHTPRFLSSRGVQTVKNLASLALTQVGLDAAGKTTILYKLKLGEIVTTIPTIGMVCTMDILFSPLPYLARFPVC